MMVFQLVVAAIIGYLLGSINSSLIVGKFYGVDVRQYGSGNAGTTNTMRTLGKKAALFVLLGDAAKGVLAYLIGFWLLGGQTGGIIAGTAAIAGHVWPLYFGFRGGKGVLTSLAVLMCIDWQISLGVLLLFIIIVSITRFVSLGSVIGALLFPITAIVLGRTPTFIICSTIIAVLIIGKHHANIKRLMTGTESKFSFSKKQA